MKQTKPGAGNTAPRQNKVRGWDWRTKAERLRLAEAARLKLKITRTQFLEQAIDEKLERDKPPE